MRAGGSAPGSPTSCSICSGFRPISWSGSVLRAWCGAIADCDRHAAGREAGAGRRPAFRLGALARVRAAVHWRGAASSPRACTPLAPRCRLRRAASSATGQRAPVRGLGATGGTLALFVAIAAGFSLWVGQSWLTIFEQVGLAVELGWHGPARSVSARRDRRIGEAAASERDEQVRGASAASSTTDAEPVRIETPLARIEPSRACPPSAQVALFSDLPADTQLPPLALLDAPPVGAGAGLAPKRCEFTSRLIEKKLADFNVAANVVAAYPGPVITRYEIEPATGVKGSQIVNLAKDLARALSLVSIRVVETIPGKSLMGLELPNPRRQTVRLSEILGSKVYADSASPLTLALGKDIAGNPMVADLAQDAAPAGRGHHRLGQVGGHQRDAAVAAVQGRPVAGAADHDRPEDARDERLRGHSAPARAGGDRHAPGGQRAELVRRRDGAALPADEHARRAQPVGLQPQDRRRARSAKNRSPIRSRSRPTRPSRWAGCRDRGGHRRARRPDDGGRQEGRGADRAARAEGARGRHPPDPRHAAPVGRRDHRPDQGQHPDAHRVPGVFQDRLAHDSRPDGRRDAARAGRHALPAAGQRHAGARARRVRGRRGSAQVVEHWKIARRTAVRRRHPRGRRAGGSRHRQRGGLRRAVADAGRSRGRWRGRPAVRPGGGGRAASTGARRSRWCSATCASATTARRACSSRWRSRDWCRRWPRNGNRDILVPAQQED